MKNVREVVKELQWPVGMTKEEGHKLVVTFHTHATQN
jgi:hypothetical protein